MSEQTTLSPTHHALIAQARQHPDHRLVPPERVRGGARRRLAEKLIALGFAEIVEDGEAAWWRDPDRGPIGLRLTVQHDELKDAPVADDRATSTKTARVLALLRDPDGADLSAITTATGWLPHTARAALTKLRRKGYAIEGQKQAGRTVYRIRVDAASIEAGR